VDVREKMRKVREELGWTVREMAYICGISENLLDLIESGEVTHPKIADRLKMVYDLTDEETEELLPLNRRVHSKNYDPDKYVDPDPIFHHETGDRMHKIPKEVMK
jgi:transcriptional regulator with XRE-family HTH domain